MTMWEPRPRGDGALDKAQPLIEAHRAEAALLPALGRPRTLWEPRPRGDAAIERRYNQIESQCGYKPGRMTIPARTGLRTM